MSTTTVQEVESFSIEGFIVSIKPPTEHRLFTTLNITNLSKTDRVKFRLRLDNA